MTAADRCSTPAARTRCRPDVPPERLAARREAPRAERARLPGSRIRRGSRGSRGSGRRRRERGAMEPPGRPGEPPVPPEPPGPQRAGQPRPSPRHRSLRSRARRPGVPRVPAAPASPRRGTRRAAPLRRRCPVRAARSAASRCAIASPTCGSSCRIRVRYCRTASHRSSGTADRSSPENRPASHGGGGGTKPPGVAGTRSRTTSVPANTSPMRRPRADTSEATQATTPKVIRISMTPISPAPARAGT